MQTGSKKNEPCGHVGIVDRVVQAIRQGRGGNRGLQFEVHGDELGLPAFFVRDAAVAVKLQTFNDNALGHGGIVVDDLSDCQAGGRGRSVMDIKMNTLNTTAIIIAQGSPLGRWLALQSWRVGDRGSRGA